MMFTYVKRSLYMEPNHLKTMDVFRSSTDFSILNMTVPIMLKPVEHLEVHKTYK